MGIIFPPFEVPQSEDHSRSCKIILVGQISPVLGRAVLTPVNSCCPLDLARLPGSMFTREVTAVQLITLHKRRLPLIDSISIYRKKYLFNSLHVLLHISVEIQQFPPQKKAARGTAAELSLECTNASCSCSVLSAAQGIQCFRNSFLCFCLEERGSQWSR